MKNVPNELNTITDGEGSGCRGEAMIDLTECERRATELSSSPTRRKQIVAALLQVQRETAEECEQDTQRLKALRQADAVLEKLKSQG